MGDDEEEPGHGHQQGVRVEQLQERARVVAVGVHGDAADDVAQGAADEGRRRQAAEEEGAVPDPAPALVAVAELERDGAQDQAEQHEHDGEVEPAEGHGISLIHISEPTRLGMISYAVFCLKKKKKQKETKKKTN